MKTIACRRPFTTLAGFLSVIGAFFLFAQYAKASTITVTNTLDHGAGSLRQAVFNASAGDKTVFSSATFNHAVTITLNSQIEISKSITIDGATGGVVTPTISGNSSVRIFLVDAGAKVTLNRLKLVNGYCSSCSGGGISNLGTLTLTQSSLISNTANGGYGGAIFNDTGGTLSVSNSTFSDNAALYVYGYSAGSGGGIYNNGSLSVAKSVFVGNTADGSPGGGIANNSGWANVSESIFTRNSAYHGGGISSSAPLTITGSTIFSNTATNGAGISNGSILNLYTSQIISNVASGAAYLWDGGGIFNHGTLKITLSKITGNTAKRGGGIYNGATLNVISSTLSGNSAGLFGGGIFNDYLANASASLVVTDSTFFTNSSGWTGGGIANTDELRLVNTTFTGNTAVQWGGGLAHYGYDIGGNIICHTFNAVNITMAGNSAPRGNEILTSCPATLTNSIVASTSPASACDFDGIAVTDGGYNLDNGNSCGFSSAHHSLINTNPLLQPFGNYGGPAPTFALSQNSPAINAANDAACPKTDERGMRRPMGTHCDIGAYEYPANWLYLPFSLE